MIISIENDGPRLVATNYWEVAEYQAAGKFYLSINERCLRVLVPRSRSADTRDMAAGKIAVLSIGPCKDWGGIEVAHLMFDDSSESPYCLFSELRAFDVLPSPADDTRTDLTCAIYAASPDLTPRLCGTLPLRIRHTSIPNFAPVEEDC